MSDTPNGQQQDPNDPISEAAWAWVIRHHEERYANDATSQALAQWLAENPRHRQAYDRAIQLWHVAGFVPPASDVDIPGSE